MAQEKPNAHPDVPKGPGQTARDLSWAALLAEVKRQHAAIARVRELHAAEYDADLESNQCYECHDDAPCPTIRALDGDNEGYQDALAVAHELLENYASQSGDDTNQGQPRCDGSGAPPPANCSSWPTGGCTASNDGYCIGGHEDGTCYE